MLQKDEGEHRLQKQKRSGVEGRVVGVMKAVDDPRGSSFN